MVTNVFLRYRIGGDQMVFRSIGENDVTADYVEGLRRQDRFLENRSASVTLESQKAYVRRIAESEHDALFGLYLNDLLVATSGAQDIRPGDAAKIGIFVFSGALRGRGFGKSLVWSACVLVNRVWRTDSFSAGMKKENVPSLKSFLACGFAVTGENEHSFAVGIGSKDLKMPDHITDITIEESTR